MAKNGKRKEPVVYSDLSDEGSEHDGVGLVMTDSDSSTGRRRKYVVSPSSSRLPSICKHQNFTRNEIICIAVGISFFVAIVILFIVIGVAASVTSAPATNLTSTSPPPLTSSTPPPVQAMPWESVRLPSNVVPDHYDVQITLDMESFDVRGNVNITCSVTSQTEFILVHVKDMTINAAASHVQFDGSEIPYEGLYYEENEFYVLKLSEKIDSGVANVHLTFNYTLRDNLAGFYRSSYMDGSNEKQYLATTQFEPTDARAAFPCFDEPALKAKFTIHITHDDKYHSVSNMPVESRTASDNQMVTTSFQTSVKMSTYLVAFIVSDFQCVSNTISENREQPLKIQVCSSPVVVDKTTYALKIATDVITFYEKEFGVTYPLPKQDLFAIPDFSAGAMENWGLITYRETALLYDNQTDPTTSKQRVAVVIAHELAHQWFGNLVTMAWWDGLWLNEGFASFMEYIGTDSTEMSWDMLDQFFVEDSTRALSLDGLNESHPILQTVSNPDEINSLFDSISYSKGGSVIRMIRHYLTEEKFRVGITHYLMSHKFGNAETAQLWEALQDVPQANPHSETVGDIMDTWTKQMGYPVFTVNQTANTLSQTRFFALKPADQSTIASSPYNYVWKAPFNYITQYNQPDLLQSMLVTTSTMSVTWGTPATTGWIKANIGHYGFYRVNYETENWRKLTSYLKQNPNSSVLTPVDRAGLLDDAFALASAGLLDSEIALDLSRYLVNEREYIPWAAALKWFHILSERLSLTALYGKYTEFVETLVRPTVNSLPMNATNLSHLQIYLRSSVLQTAWQFGNRDVLQSATDLFQAWKTQNQSINPDLKSVVYSAGIANGDDKDWDYVWDRYNSETDPYEKRLLLKALAYSTQPWVLSRYLNYSVERLRSQDTLSVVVYISRNVHGKSLVWNFVRNNWAYISEKFSSSSFFDRLILYITESFSTDFELHEVIDFFSKNPDAGSGTRAYRQSIEIIRGNIAWLSTNQGLANSLAPSSSTDYM